MLYSATTHPGLTEEVRAAIVHDHEQNQPSVNQLHDLSPLHFLGSIRRKPWLVWSLNSFITFHRYMMKKNTGKNHRVDLMEEACLHDVVTMAESCRTWPTWNLSRGSPVSRSDHCSTGNPNKTASTSPYFMTPSRSLIYQNQNCC